MGNKMGVYCGAAIYVNYINMQGESLLALFDRELCCS